MILVESVRCFVTKFKLKRLDDLDSNDIVDGLMKDFVVYKSEMSLTNLLSCQI